MGSSGSRRRIDVVVVEPSTGRSVDEAPPDVVVVDLSGSVDVVELVAMVEPGTSSGRSLDAHPTATITVTMTAPRGRIARLMARDPIDPSEQAVVAWHR